MPKKKNHQFPQEVVDNWPEVFKDIEINSVPIEYLRSVLIYFKDGNVWDVDIAKNKEKTLSTGEIEESIEQLLEEYDEHIRNVDFQLDVEKVKRDITRRTKYFLKKRK